MIVNVYEARRYSQSACIDPQPRAGAGQLAQSGDRVAAYSYVGLKIWVPGAIHYPAAVDQYVERRLLGSGWTEENEQAGERHKQRHSVIMIRNKG
jgi:hypothetical protein